MKTEITIDGQKFVAALPNGNRHVVVVDRGWIFAGDVTDKDGRIYIDRAVWVFGWQSVGFAAVVADPRKSKADIRPLTTRVDLPADAELFRLPVAADWGL
jgi:hypothetical protein